MFGRSGQMFPRRTFHDAIYEEEYGSDNEDECCRCRGLSAILCWFLSVIILVGLAATVVLTVFFILRSRTLMVKPDVDVDVELYGKDQNLFESKGGGGGGSSKELVGSNEVTTASSSPKRKKSNNTKGSGRGPPDATKNDVDADVNEEQNAINDSSSDHEEQLAEDASVNHPRNQHPNHHNRNRLQPYSPIKTTTTTSTTSTTTTTTEAPQTAAADKEQSDEENNQNESSSEEESDTEQQQNNGEGSSLFNLFSGPRNPSYSTPSQNEDEEEEEEDAEEDDGNNEDDDANQLNTNSNTNNNSNGGTSAEYVKPTRYQTPVQQVLFTESPKVTVTTPSPYGSRRNFQTTRISTGRTSFTSTTTTTMPPSEESEEEEEKANKNEDETEQHAEENEEDEDNEEAEKSSEEKQEASPPEVASSPQTTTSVYDDGTVGNDNSSGGGSRESGENQLKQMLLDSIPPHGAKKDAVDEDDGDKAKEDEEEESSDDEEMGGMSSSSEFNLSQKVQTTTQAPATTTVKPVKTTKPTKQRGSGDTISRLISRNFTRKTTSTTTELNEAASSETETQTERPSSSSATTIGPAGHKYDYTMTPIQRTKLKIKSTESVEQEAAVTSTPKPPPKFTLKQRFRSTTVKPNVVVTPEPPSTAAPRTRGTTPATSTEYGIKLGGKRGSVESPIDIVPSPDLSPKGQLKQQIQRLKEQQQKKQQQQQQNSFEGVDLNSASSEDQSKTSSEQQFLDVLVGASDQKTLVTKKTEDGIVTSAILPPWYDSNGANSSISDVLATNGTTLSNAVAKVPTDEAEDDTSGENSFGEKTTIIKKKSSEEKSSLAPSKEDAQGPSEFERLVNMFSKQERSSEEITAVAPPPTNRFGFKKQKPLVLKKPGGSMTSRYIPQVPGRANLFPSSSSSTEAKSTENKSSGGPSPSPASPEADATTTNLERPAGDVGRTGVLPTAADVEAAVANAGFYPGNDGNMNNGAGHQMLDSERLHSEETDSAEEDDDGDDDEQGNPSHVIDVNIAEDSPAEIIIEQDASSGPSEDEEGDFVEDEDYGAYGENPPTLAMSGSTPNEKVLPPPEDYVLRGSGIRRPMSSEETDMEQSASAPVENNATTTQAPSQMPSTPTPVAAIRRPAYTREEIAKSSVKPSPESLGGNTLNDDREGHTGSMEEEFEEEYEDDDNYEGGSLEQPAGGGSLEQWSSERIGAAQKWSAPDKMMDAVEGHQEEVGTGIQKPRPTLSEELTEPGEMHESAESIAHPTVQQSPPPANALDNHPVTTVDNSTGVFRPPQLVSFHENKLSFSSPPPLDGEYHSKDGWRPVLTNTGPAASQEHISAQAGSFEPEEELEDEHEEHAHDEGSEQQMFQEAPPTQQQQPHIAPVQPMQVVKPPPQQQWAQEQPPQQQQQQMVHPPPLQQQPMKHNSIIPPPVPATVKFPDSEEDHEDRRHHGRRRIRPGQQPQGQFDRGKYMVRPVPPPIVMRRRPHSGGPFPPPGRQGPPPPHQRPPPPQMMQQAASQQNPQFTEQPPPPPQGRPPHPPINRNFHIRQNPMRRFNFGGGGGGPPQAQPRSGGNIKWPTDDGEVGRGDSNNNNSQEQNIEGVQSEVSINKRRRRRRRAPVPIPAA